MQIHNLIQGSPEWLAFRAVHRTASEAPIMLGLSPEKSRDELLHEKHTEITKDVSWFVQKIFDKGHRFEKIARPRAEEIIGEELSPVTGSDGIYSASFDGLTIMDDIGWEHKQLNKTLAAVKTIDELDIKYKVQMEQQAMVSGAEKILFSATDWKKSSEPTPYFITETIDDVEVTTYYELAAEVHLWYTPDPELRQRIILGWAQFEKDLAAYVPKESKALPVAEVQIQLPTLYIAAVGEITESNMVEYGDALAQRLKEVRAIKLITDQDFSNAKAAASTFRDQYKKLGLAIDAMLSQTMTIGEATRMIEAWREDLRVTALKLEKDVEKADLEKKAEMIKEANAKINLHISAVEVETNPIKIVINKPNFAEAIKGKRNYDSMQSAINDMVAAFSTDVDVLATALKEKYGWYAQESMKHAELFPDLQAIIYKQADDFKLLVQSRINAMLEKRRAEEEARAAAQKAAEEAAAKVSAEKEAQAKAAEQEKLDAAVPSATVATTQSSNVVEMRPQATEELRSAVVEHQDEISAFLATIDVSDKTKNTVRAYLVEFVKFQKAYAAKKSA